MPAGINIEKFTGDVTFEMPTLASILRRLGVADKPSTERLRVLKAAIQNETLFPLELEVLRRDGWISASL